MSLSKEFLVANRRAKKNNNIQRTHKGNHCWSNSQNLCKHAREFGVWPMWCRIASSDLTPVRANEVRSKNLNILNAPPTTNTSRANDWLYSCAPDMPLRYRSLALSSENNAIVLFSRTLWYRSHIPSKFATFCLPALLWWNSCCRIPDNMSFVFPLGAKNCGYGPTAITHGIAGLSFMRASRPVYYTCSGSRANHLSSLHAWSVILPTRVSRAQ